MPGATGFLSVVIVLPISAFHSTLLPHDAQPIVAPSLVAEPICFKSFHISPVSIKSGLVELGLGFGLVGLGEVGWSGVR